MSMKYLGETIDIHCGGKDLLFPHHENEVAQSEGATGKPFAHYWMHNGHINVDNQKMSKSLGNFFTVRDISKEYDLEAVRMFMVSAHYRSPVNFSKEMIEQARSALERMYNGARQLLFLLDHAPERELNSDETALMERARNAVERFDEAMDDDLNTADAVGVIFELIKDGNTSLNADSARAAIKGMLDTLKELTGVLGIMSRESDAVPDDIKALVEQRVQARAAKNWAESDRLRDLITERGFVLEDTPQGPKVRRA